MLRPSRRWMWIVATAAVVFGSSSLLLPLSADHDAFVYAADRMLRGEVLYRDLFDVNPPGVFFTYGLAQFVLGKSVLTIRILDLVWQTLSALAVGSIALRLSRRDWVAAVAGASYLFGYFATGWWDTGLSDSLLSLPLAGGVLFALRALEDRRRRSWFAAGLLVAVATIFKYPIGIFLPALTIVAFADSLPPAAAGSGRRIAAALRGPVLVAAGFAVPVACVCGYFLVMGGWSRFIEVEFRFAPLYAWSTHRTASTGGFLAILALCVDSAPDRWYRVLTTVGLVEAAWCGWKRQLTLRHWLVVAWLASAMISVVIQGRFWWKTYEPLLGPGAVLSATALCRLADAAKRSGRAATVLAGAVAVGLVGRQTLAKYWEQIQPQVGVVTGATSLDEYREGFGPKEYSVRRQVRLGDFLHDHTTPEDTIYIWAYALTSYVRADRRVAARFIIVHYVYASWAPPQYKRELMDSLRANVPKYFVVGTGDAEPVATLLPYGSDGALERFDELREFVRERYVFDRDIDGFLVYRRK